MCFNLGLDLIDCVSSIKGWASLVYSVNPQSQSKMALYLIIARVTFLVYPEGEKKKKF